MSPINGFTTCPRVRAAPFHRMTTSPTCKKDSATEPRRALANAVCVDHSETPRLSTENSAAPPTPLGDITTEPRGLTEAQSRPADFFTTAAVPGRSAALVVCVASSTAAAAQGDAAQPAFDSKILHYRHQIPDPSSHPNPAACSRHRIMPQRTPDVGNIPSTQMET